MRLAYDHLSQAVIWAEKHLKNRGRMMAMLSAIYAYVCFFVGKNEKAAQMLEAHIQQIVAHGIPEVLVTSYFVLAQIAGDNGKKDQAELLCKELRAYSRGNIRIEIASELLLVELHCNFQRLYCAQSALKRAQERIQESSEGLPAIARLYLSHKSQIASLHIAATFTSCITDTTLAEADAALKIAMEIGRGQEIVEVLLARMKIHQYLGDNQNAVRDYSEAEILIKDNGLNRFTSKLSEFNKKSGSVLREPRLQSGIQTVTQNTAIPKLTTRQIQVIQGLENQLSNKEIARALMVSENTVKWHLKKLFQILEVYDRREVVRRAQSIGLI
jgi:LuxR family maltose regulon positive regulatory protein